MESAITALPEGDQPIRAEVFGIERLEQHANTLAQAQGITEKLTKGRKLLPRVRDNWRALLASYRDIVAAVRDKHEITQAEEWLLDNFFIVEEQLREVRDHLPSSFYRVLPKIAEGQLEGYPRVYGLVWAYPAGRYLEYGLVCLKGRTGVGLARRGPNVHLLGSYA